MRVNVYAEEMTERIEIISKTIEGQGYTGLRLYLYLPVKLPDLVDEQGKVVEDRGFAQGPFMHGPNDDDSAAVTFWGKQDLRKVLRLMLAKLDEHYADKERKDPLIYRQCGMTTGFGDSTRPPCTGGEPPSWRDNT